MLPYSGGIATSKNTMELAQLLKDHSLTQCIERATTGLKQVPTDIKQRVFLFQLLCVLYEFDRAATQLNTLADLSDVTLALKSTYQQLLLAEKTRFHVFEGSVTPTIFGEPPSWVSYYLEALSCFSRNNTKAAKVLIENGAEHAQASAGTINGTPFNWIADGDVRFGPMLEIIINGQYYWLPFCHIKQIDIEAIEDLRDLVWCPCHITLTNLGEVFAFIPTRYPPMPDDSDAVRLAKVTLWHAPEENLYLGQGLRTLITDNGEYPLSQIQTLVLNPE